MDKKLLRQICSEKRNIFAKTYHHRSLFPALLSQFGAEFWSGKILSSFIKFRDEIDCRPTELSAMAHGASIAYPRVVAPAQPLQFHLYNEGDDLITEHYGTRAPQPTAPMVQPDILLVPLLGFDNNFYRLGYGGGFYDRTIAQLRAQKNIIAIGVGYSVQHCETTMPEQYDEKLDYILTEQGFFKGQA